MGIFQLCQIKKGVQTVKYETVKNLKLGDVISVNYTPSPGHGRKLVGYPATVMSKPLDRINYNHKGVPYVWVELLVDGHKSV